MHIMKNLKRPFKKLFIIIKRSISLAQRKYENRCKLACTHNKLYLITTPILCTFVVPILLIIFARVTRKRVYYVRVYDNINNAHKIYKSMC